MYAVYSLVGLIPLSCIRNTWIMYYSKSIGQELKVFDRGFNVHYRGLLSPSIQVKAGKTVIDNKRLPGLTARVHNRCI